MTGALIILAVTALVGLLLWLFDKKKPDPPVQQDDEPQECCGMHAVCEKQLLSPVSPEIEYFDDEELDDYRGRPAGGYSESEIEQFREVMLTLPPDDVSAWARSLQLREIELPTPLRDELFIIVNEQRGIHTD